MYIGYRIAGKFRWCKFQWCKFCEKPPDPSEKFLTFFAEQMHTMLTSSVRLTTPLSMVGQTSCSPTAAVQICL